jgi:peptidoglycan hydrolase-like protein with peptidoglycan-binding domain
VPPSIRRFAISVVAAALCLGAVATPAAVAKRSTGLHLGDRALRAGAAGSDVRELQKALRKAGFSVKVDGQFGPSTVRAVKRFQRAAQLTASGTVGRKTIAALRAAARGSSANVSAKNGGTSATARSRNRGKGRAKSLGDRVPVRQGMHGHDIRVLQDLLGDAGYDVVVDGEFGSRTFNAVKDFEGAHQRPVDGIMDEDDITTLRAAAAAGPAVTPAAAAPAVNNGARATVGPDGLAVAPAGAPPQVQAIIAAGNQIASKPYKYGGGHGKWDDTGYDCSGSVSFALHGAGLLEDAMPSGSFTSWGDAGPGQWVTIYANGGHMYMVVAGLRFDTSGRSNHNTRWQAEQRSGAGYTVRHPPGL